MSDFVSEAKTNTTANSKQDINGHGMPAIVHFFIVTDEIGKDGFLVRKIYASPTDPYLVAKNLPEFQIRHEIWPEKYGMRPVDPKSGTSVAEHVISSRKYPSDYLSTSSEFPNGSPRFDGKAVYIDIEKAKAAGAKLVSTDEIIKALEEYKAKFPKTTAKIDQLIQWVRDIDKEVLVKGSVPANAIFTPRSYAVTSGIVRGLKVVRIFAIIYTAYDLEQAGQQSIQQNSVKPISREVIRQAGGWGGAMAGARIGAAVGAACGIETGPGAIVTGAIGGIIFCTAGYFGADWIAGYIQ